MPKLPSSKAIINILEKEGFAFVHQRGSHAKYRKGSATVIVPNPKKEIPLGTFKSIIRQSKLPAERFNKF